MTLMSDRGQVWLGFVVMLLLAFGAGGILQRELISQRAVIDDLDTTIQAISPLEAEFLALIDETDTAAIEGGHTPILHQLALLVVLQNPDDVTQCIQALAWYGMDGEVKGEILSDVVECPTVAPTAQ